MLRGCLPMVEGRWCWDRVRSRWTARVLQESDGSARRNAFFMLYNADEALAIQYFTRIAEDVRDGSVARVCVGGGRWGFAMTLRLLPPVPVLPLRAPARVPAGGHSAGDHGVRTQGVPHEPSPEVSLHRRDFRFPQLPQRGGVVRGSQHCGESQICPATRPVRTRSC